VFLRERLTAGTRFEGPAVIEQLDSTTLVPPEVAVEVDDWLNLRIHVGEASQ
jgi:N-methylhydantoinase A